MGMPSKAKIVKYWKDWLIENVFDLGEPSCWACRIWWDTKYDIRNPNASWDEICGIWNKVSQLQRCHIIPRSLGGSDEPSNLFLMCKECHDRAPNTTSKEMFLKWVDAQDWFKRRFIEIQEESQTFGFNENEYEKIIKILELPEFNKWFKENAGIHRSQAGYGPKLTQSTLFALVREYQNKMTKTPQ